MAAPTACFALSEEELQGKLDFTIEVARACKLAERSYSAWEGVRHVGTWIVEAGVIERVVGLSPELELVFLGEAKVFEQGEVHVREGRSG